MAEGFVHLHNHTEYSMLDGAARVDEMVLAAKADGQRAIAITDHGNLYGVIDFYEACRRHDVTPIIGLEAYMAANSRFDRPARRGKIDDTGGDSEGGQKLYHHLTVLAMTNEGYKNLRELSSKAFLEGYYYKPRLDWELLERYAAGLVATSGCLGGVVLQALLQNDYVKALELAGSSADDLWARELLHRVARSRPRGPATHEPPVAAHRERSERAAARHQRPALRADTMSTRCTTRSSASARDHGWPIRIGSDLRAISTT